MFCFAYIKTERYSWNEKNLCFALVFFFFLYAVSFRVFAAGAVDDCSIESMILNYPEGSTDLENTRHKSKTAEINSAEKRLEISDGLLQMGRITQTEYMEAENEVLRLKYELREIEAEILSCFYILDNGIESA